MAALGCLLYSAHLVAGFWIVEGALRLVWFLVASLLVYILENNSGLCGIVCYLKSRFLLLMFHGYEAFLVYKYSYSPRLR